MEREIIAACIADRKAYDAIQEHIDPKEIFSALGQFWWKFISAWYRRDPKCSGIAVSLLLEQAAPDLSRTKQAETLRSVLPSGDGAGVVSVANVVSSVLDLRKRALLFELGATDLSGNKQKADRLFAELADIWGKSELDANARTEAKDAAELFEVLGPEHRIKLLPAALNERIGGGALPGQHIVVFGRTEVGKSTFVLNLCAGFLKQGLKTLYIGNEDPIDAIKFRFICRVAKATAEEAHKAPARVVAAYAERRGPELCRFLHLSPGSVSAIEKEVDDFEPRVIVIDQIRNVDGPEPDITRRIEANAIRFRGLLSRRALLGVSVTQAADRSERHNAEPPIWLATGDCADSRVGLPAQADLMLGIGANNQMMQQNQRAISLCKNKLASGPQSRTGLIVTVDLERGIVRS